MVLVITIPIGILITVGIVGWIVINAAITRRRREKLRKLRIKQEAATLRSLERSLRPPLRKRLFAFRRGKKADDIGGSVI